MTYIFPPYQKAQTESSELTLPKSRELLRAISQHDFCTLIETGIFTDTDSEYIVVEVDIERNQFPLNPIEYKERVLIQVINNDHKVPWVYLLREDFPSLPHQNLLHFEKPRSLCLFDQPAEEILLSWTGFSFIERIRQWLSLSASGTLHSGDQPLEPFILYDEGTIILPSQIRDGEIVSVKLASNLSGKYNLVANINNTETSSEEKYIIRFFTSPPQVHGIINTHPQNLSDLITIFEKCGLDLESEILNLSKNSKAFKLYLIFILSIPTKRNISSEVERVQQYAFLSINTFEDIGIATSILGKVGNQVSILLGAKVDREASKNLQISVLIPYVQYSKNLAKLLSQSSNELNILQIGVGAIGSEIFNLLSRSGFGKSWTLVDNDVFLPHNLYRHSLLRFQVGDYKANALASIANHILDDNNYSSAIIEKVSNSSISQELLAKMQDSNLIIDTSASLAFSRTLSKMDDVTARRVSVFLNPKGNDLVFLAEDHERKVKLDELEMLYYKAINDEANLNDHFRDLTNKVRYGNSCRDISNSIPNEHFGIFSSIASNIIKKIDQESTAFIKIWRLNNDLSVTAYNIPVNRFNTTQINDWQVVINLILLDKIKKQRKSVLPSETGGILIGCFDMNAKKIYIVDSIFSPKDSKEYPMAYYRGIDGVSENLSSIEEHTNGFLTYIGEWHSHPNNCSVNQSSDDLKLFAWITQFLKPRGLPGVMLIVGEKRYGLFVE